MVLVDVMELYAIGSEVISCHGFVLTRSAGPDNNEVTSIMESVNHIRCMRFYGTDVWVIGIHDGVIVVNTYDGLHRIFFT
jgi:hypothetical protein